MMLIFFTKVLQIIEIVMALGKSYGSMRSAMAISASGRCHVAYVWARHKNGCYRMAHLLPGIHILQALAVSIGTIMVVSYAPCIEL